MIIRTTYSIIIEAFDKPVEPLTDELEDELFEPIYKNKIKIFETAGSIERLIDLIIAEYFYGDYSETNKDFRKRFKNLVLSSDWCSFATKKKLVIHIITEFNFLNKKEKEEFNQLLFKTMSYRNAFAHGTTVTDGRIVKLRYYEGGQKEKKLDDTYFSEVQSNLNKCYVTAEHIAKQKMNLFKSS